MYHLQVWAKFWHKRDEDLRTCIPGVPLFPPVPSLQYRLAPLLLKPKLIIQRLKCIITTGPSSYTGRFIIHSSHFSSRGKAPSACTGRAVWDNSIKSELTWYYDRMVPLIKVQLLTWKSWSSHQRSWKIKRCCSDTTFFSCCARGKVKSCMQMLCQWPKQMCKSGLYIAERRAAGWLKPSTDCTLDRELNVLSFQQRLSGL